jgi:hypothetical protein
MSNAGKGEEPLLPELPEIVLPEEYKAARKVRNQAGRRRVAEEGRLPNGRPPFGYWLVTKRDVMMGKKPWSELGKLIEHEENAGIVRGIFRDYLRLRSVVEVADHLNQIGTPSPTGRTWYGTTVANLLRNTAYVGRYVWGKSRESGVVSRETEVVSREAGVVIACPAIVGERVFELTQMLLEGQEPRGRVRGEARQPLLLGDIARCTGCGGLLESGKYVANRARGIRGGAFYACKRCPPCYWNSNSPRPRWCIYPWDKTEKAAMESLLGLLLEEDRAMVTEMLFSPHVNVSMVSRRKLLIQSGVTPWVTCEPFAVKIGYREQREIPEEKLGLMMELLVSGARSLSERAHWAWVYLEGRDV